MRTGEIVRRIIELGGVEIRRSGSHRRFQAAAGGVVAQTTVPDHNRDIGPGLLRAIERQMEPVFGEGWLR